MYEVSHHLDVPTLHTIGMLRRAKLPIRSRMAMRLVRGAVIFGTGNGGGCQQAVGSRVGATDALEAPVQAIQCLGHSVPSQCAHIPGLGLRKKFRHITCRDCVLF